MYAVENGHPKAVEALINAGADVKAKDKSGRMAIDYTEETYAREELRSTDALRRLEELSK
jgi:ABC-type phosphate/phosphonate transport system substrate-binding protein